MISAIVPAAQIALRYIIIAAVQLGIWTTIERFVMPLIHGAITAVAVKFGVSESDAKDILSNDLLEFGETVGIFALTMKSKVPLKVAELLGFTTKGWSRRVLSQKVAGIATTAKVSIKASPIGGLGVTKTTAPSIISGARGLIKGFAVGYGILLGTFSTVFLGALVIGNWVDFGNWNNGAYQKKMQKLLAWISFGFLVPDTDYRQAKTLSPEIFNKVYETFKIEGAVGINDPYKSQTVIFTRDNLMDMLDVIGAELLRLEGSASTKTVLKHSLPFIIFTESVEAPVAQQQISQARSVPQIKVFTGVITQGKLGSPGAFVARETDLIDDMSELTQSAQNNLASFVMALAGRIVYEIKIVSSVVSKDGFVQRGTTQKIISGYNSVGAPKYKTVVNKFAQLNVYVLTGKGVRSKIDTVTLGPVNSASFQPSSSEIQLAESQIKSNIVTTDVNEINTIVTQTPTEVEVTPVVVASPYTSAVISIEPDEWFRIGGDNYVYRLGLTGIIRGDTWENFKAYTARGRLITGDYRAVEDDIKTFTPEQIDQAWQELKTKTLEKGGGEELRNDHRNIREFISKSTQTAQQTAQNTSNDIPPSNNPNKCNVGTIAEFFDVNRAVYPQLAERAILYEKWGLGLAAYYTGTAEQNNKFLAEVKRRSGC